MPKPHRTQLRAALASLLALAALAATAPSASAISDAEELGRFGGLGSAAGELGEIANGIATDPTTGHVFVTGTNNRVDEFTPWGGFVKAFGWDVAPGAVNEQQEVRVRAAAGQFKLTFGASTTPDLAFNAQGAESEGPGSVEAALNALPSIASGGGSVSVEAVPGTTDGVAPFVYVVAFKGSLAGTDVTQLTASNGTTPLGGGVPSTTLEARTRADGSASGTGLESCTAESGCKQGLEGAGAGQFNRTTDIVVDAGGNVYVKESGFGNNRVQKFDSVGRFILMFGGEVDKTTGEDRCTAASGDECGIGVAGTGPGQFSSGGSEGIALGSSGQLYVADNDRIQRFDLKGEYEASLPVPGQTVRDLAFDPVGEALYATFIGELGFLGVRKLNSTTGVQIDQLEGQFFVATDPAGNLFALGAGEEHGGTVVQYDFQGKPLSPFSCCAPELLGFAFQALATNAVGDLYVAYRQPGGDNFIRFFGPGPVSFEAPPKVPPSIDAQYATEVERNGAVLRAEINPRFWTTTRYYVQYGTGKCSEGGCVEEKPLAPGAILTSKPINRPVRSAGVFLSGLEPGTTYHYRFVAESSGGGPVRGVGGEVGSDGEEGSFTTYPVAAPPKSDCPNQAVRTGFSAPLPDCRAFEMVSPLDKNNGDIANPLGGAPLVQSSTEGDRFTYSSYRAFADAQAGVTVNQYLASRGAGVGWSSEALAPPHGPAAHQSDTNGIFRALENEYKAFSPDLCTSWLVLQAEAPLAPAATEGYLNLYRRDGCGSAGYSALVGVEPQLEGLPPFIPKLQGTSAEGSEAIFQAWGALTPEAASDAYQTYYASDGGVRLICILPDGTPNGANCSGGTNGETGFSSLALSSLSNAISADGRRVYWTASIASANGAGKVYLRENPGQPQSAIEGGECSEPEMACTLEVSGTKSPKAARFLGASPDGSKALFRVTEGTQSGNLYEFDREASESTLIAKGSLGVAGASEDLSHVYFVSTEALAEGALAGKPNLYLYSEGTQSVIATLSDADVNDGLPNDVSPRPDRHAARVSPDGRHLAFISTQQLSGYDNADQATGEAASEVYLYEAGAPAPLCVSCNPSGARPRGEVVPGPQNSASSLATAAWLPPAHSELYASRPLAEDGSRLFFNSYDALLPRDTNGKVDVYEWEAASGPKECEEKGAELHVASSEGCLSLISSGESPDDSEFLDASAGGRDVFFTTNASLLPQDYGLIDVYDARAGGGLPAPPEPPEPCQGDACQVAPPPPNDPTPASASFRGAGNPKPAGRCAKGKVARKGRCVARKHKRAKRRHRARHANENRRAPR